MSTRGAQQDNRIDQPGQLGPASGELQNSPGLVPTHYVVKPEPTATIGEGLEQLVGAFSIFLKLLIKILLIFRKIILILSVVVENVENVEI